MNTLLADLTWAVVYWITRIDGKGAIAQIEILDFKEQLASCDDDATRLVMCRRWLTMLKG
jgi:hypothetical protein